MKIGCIVMAAGNARRFGSNKLDARVEGKTLLRRALEAREEERLRRVLDQLRSWGTDCAGVGSQVSRADPARWEKLGSQWTRLFSTVPVEISVEVSLGDR